MDICNAPCIIDIRRKLDGLDNKMDLLDLLQTLITGIADTQAEQAEQQQQNDFVTLSVPIVSCNPDGSATATPTPIQVPEAQAAATQQQFAALASLQIQQCKIQRHTERSHNILGGDVWFQDAASREPELKTKVETEIKKVGTLFGFPALPTGSPNQPTSTPSAGTPGDAGNANDELKAKSLIELMNAYASNLYHRAGFQGFPANVPPTLLGYTDADSLETIRDLSTYFVWYVKQFDALVGKFPINIRVEDIDPLTPGNQIKEIELPNISETLAELYGMNIGTSVNADVSVNFLMRLASEMIATKNSSLITQDYAKANAAFLGYKGNAARREINYSFDPAKLGSLDEFLKESKGYLVGWEEDDKESVVGFLQRIVFASGIIKAAFFRDNQRLAELQKEIESMMKGDKVATDAEWEAILLLINNPTEYFNQDAIPKPRVREKPAPPPPEPTP